MIKVVVIKLSTSSNRSMYLAKRTYTDRYGIEKESHQFDITSNKMQAIQFNNVIDLSEALKIVDDASYKVELEAA